MKLHKLAHISTGYSFRSKIKHDPEGGTKVIQMSNVDLYRGILEKELMSIDNFNPRDDRYHLDPGDLIMTSKGYNLMAFVVPQGLGEAIAVNSFLVIKMKSNKLLPDYLAWYLNSERTQHFFKKMAAGTQIPNLSKKALAELDIKFPSLEKQDLLANLDMLKRKEIFLHQEIARKKGEVMNAMLQKKADEWLIKKET